LGEDLVKRLHDLALDRREVDGLVLSYELVEVSRTLSIQYALDHYFPLLLWLIADARQVVSANFFGLLSFDWPFVYLNLIDLVADHEHLRRTRGTLPPSQRGFFLRTCCRLDHTSLSGLTPSHDDAPYGTTHP
jgi:hypothetical protein